MSASRCRRQSFLRHWPHERLVLSDRCGSLLGSRSSVRVAVCGPRTSMRALSASNKLTSVVAPTSSSRLRVGSGLARVSLGLASWSPVHDTWMILTCAEAHGDVPADVAQPWSRELVAQFVCAPLPPACLDIRRPTLLVPPACRRGSPRGGKVEARWVGRRVRDALRAMLLPDHLECTLTHAMRLCRVARGHFCDPLVEHCTAGGRSSRALARALGLVALRPAMAPRPRFEVLLCSLALVASLPVLAETQRRGLDVRPGP